MDLLNAFFSLALEESSPFIVLNVFQSCEQIFYGSYAFSFAVYFLSLVTIN